MIKPDDIAALGQQLLGAIPTSVLDTHRDIEKNLHALLQSAFARLDLVNRAEFDAQAAVLHRTRRKLDDLEEQLTALENDLVTHRQEAD